MARFHRASPQVRIDPDRFMPSPGVVCAVCGTPAPRRVRREVAKMFPRIWRLVTPHAHFPFCFSCGLTAAMRAHAGLHPIEDADVPAAK